MSDWDASGSEAEPAPAQSATVKTKWEGEDEEENCVASDWEDSSDGEKAKPKATTSALPPKKKGTLKQKLAQKEAEKSERLARGELSDDEEIEMHPQEKARLDREREIAADLKNAADLLGTSSIGGGPLPLDEILSFNPKTKEDFEHLSSLIIEQVLRRHESKPLYHYFVEYHVKELSQPLKDLEVRKAASALTTLANEKQKEQRDKSSGKKKPKAATKTIGAAKVVGKIDTTSYNEALDDFGGDDFM